MKILSIDTSSDICGVALLENDNLIDDNSISNGMTHSENLMPLISELLKRNNIELKEINLIACSVGPGSFTGIRIGVSTAKAFAEVNNIKIAEVTSLETLSQNIENSDTKVSLIDARNNQVYCGIFDNNGILKEEYLADDINVIIERMSKYKDITVVGSGAELHKALLTEKILDIKFSKDNFQTAIGTGIVGYKKSINNDLKNADEFLPIYLKKSQAERLKK